MEYIWLKNNKLNTPIGGYFANSIKNDCLLYYFGGASVGWKEFSLNLTWQSQSNIDNCQIRLELLHINSFICLCSCLFSSKFLIFSKAVRKAWLLKNFYKLYVGFLPIFFCPHALLNLMCLNKATCDLDLFQAWLKIEATSVSKPNCQVALEGLCVHYFV